MHRLMNCFRWSKQEYLLISVRLTNVKSYDINNIVLYKHNIIIVVIIISIITVIMLRIIDFR